MCCQSSWRWRSCHWSPRCGTKRDGAALCDWSCRRTRSHVQPSTGVALQDRCGRFADMKSPIPSCASTSRWPVSLWFRERREALGLWTSCMTWEPVGDLPRRVAAQPPAGDQGGQIGQGGRCRATWGWNLAGRILCRESKCCLFPGSADGGAPRDEAERRGRRRGKDVCETEWYCVGLVLWMVFASLPVHTKCRAGEDIKACWLRRCKPAPASSCLFLPEATV